jgi:DNA-binding response OmpR family regulator
MTAPAQHLLVVEHDLRVGSYITQALRAEAYQVEWATTGDEALACAHRAPPDLVVLDATRPDQDRVALAKALRAERAGVPIVVVTTGSGADAAAWEDITPARLGKPFRLDDLLGQVEALLGR